MLSTFTVPENRKIMTPKQHGEWTTDRNPHRAGTYSHDQFEIGANVRKKAIEKAYDFEPIVSPSSPESDEIERNTPFPFWRAFKMLVVIGLVVAAWTGLNQFIDYARRPGPAPVAGVDYILIPHKAVSISAEAKRAPRNSYGHYIATTRSCVALTRLNEMVVRGKTNGAFTYIQFKDTSLFNFSEGVAGYKIPGGWALTSDIAEMQKTQPYYIKGPFAME